MNLLNIKRTMYHDQGSFILEIHYGSLLGSLLISPINMSKEKYMIVFIDAKKHLLKFHYSFLVITLKERTENKNVCSQHDTDDLWPISS